MVSHMKRYLDTKMSEEKNKRHQSLDNQNRSHYLLFQINSTQSLLMVPQQSL
jgi:hypothetical protein